ncbi:hypothetical protein GCM10020331_039180 [Ectobacillus funiculus]
MLGKTNLFFLLLHMVVYTPTRKECFFYEPATNTSPPTDDVHAAITPISSWRNEKGYAAKANAAKADATNADAANANAANANAANANAANANAANANAANANAANADAANANAANANAANANAANANAANANAANADAADADAANANATKKRQGGILSKLFGKKKIKKFARYRFTLYAKQQLRLPDAAAYDASPSTTGSPDKYKYPDDPAGCSNKRCNSKQHRRNWQFFLTWSPTLPLS